MSSDTAASRGMVSVDSALERPSPLSLARQASIYSLTLDEFQNHIGEPGKNFGSMNMDEFISNIWTAEESQAVSAAAAAMGADGGTLTKREVGLPCRQGSLALTPPLGRKTVEEVWSEIQRGQQQQLQHGANTVTTANNGCRDPAPPVYTRQPTFGEMTLEDFLIKAGVVRNDNKASMFNGREPESGHVLGTGYSDRNTGNGDFAGTHRIVPSGIAGFPVQMMMHQPGSGDPTDAAMKRPVGNNGWLRGRAAMGEYSNGGFNCTNPSSKGMCLRQMESGRVSPAVQYGMDMEVQGRKRPLEGPVEKVVERRQRRMIKNRESAARSRARKQAYTAELEAELNQLKEENARLRKLQEEEKEKRNKKLLEALAPSSTEAQKKTLRRTFTGPW